MGTSKGGRKGKTASEDHSRRGSDCGTKMMSKTRDERGNKLRGTLGEAVGFVTGYPRW